MLARVPRTYNITALVSFELLIFGTRKISDRSLLSTRSLARPFHFFNRVTTLLLSSKYFFPPVKRCCGSEGVKIDACLGRRYRALSTAESNRIYRFHVLPSGLMWLIMVGMDTTGACSRGILSVVMRQRVESPEEQYDRLVSPPPPPPRE